MLSGAGKRTRTDSADQYGVGEVLLLAACAAARIGEVSAVRAADIDLATWTWTVRHQTTPSPGELTGKGTKGTDAPAAATNRRDQATRMSVARPQAYGPDVDGGRRGARPCPSQDRWPWVRCPTLTLGRFTNGRVTQLMEADTARHHPALPTPGPTGNRRGRTIPCAHLQGGGPTVVPRSEPFSGVVSWQPCDEAALDQLEHRQSRAASVRRDGEI